VALSNIELSSCVDPAGPAAGDNRVSRGFAATFFVDQYDHRWRRRRDPPGYRYNWLGFRLAKSVP
jgi:formylglycine-generating enzyme required for sulfatase activity